MIKSKRCEGREAIEPAERLEGQLLLEYPVQSLPSYCQKVIRGKKYMTYGAWIAWGLVGLVWFSVRFDRLESIDYIMNLAFMVIPFIVTIDSLEQIAFHKKMQSLKRVALTEHGLIYGEEGYSWCFLTSVFEDKKTISFGFDTGYRHGTSIEMPAVEGQPILPLLKYLNIKGRPRVGKSTYIFFAIMIAMLAYFSLKPVVRYFWPSLWSH